jgi:ferredoxin-NADP reductase
MNGHVVKVLEANYVTYDVKRFLVEKPKGYTFIPGQATDISINIPEWKDQLRPFTFTSLKSARKLEFLIKIYRDHDGVTKKLESINAGDELILHNVFGAIHYEKPGIFIAAGTGITPFLAIFRELEKTKKLKGNKLIYVNKTKDDIILGQELFKMFKNNFLNVLTREHTVGFVGKRIDRNFLIANVIDFSQHFYVCGPDLFVKDILKILTDLGANVDSLVFEK